VARRQLLPKKTVTKAKAKAKPIPKKKKKTRRIVRISRTGLVQAWRQGLKFKKFQRQTQRGDVAKAAATAKTMGEYLKVTPPLSAEATQEGVTQEGYEEYEAAVLFSEDEEEGIENEGHEEEEEEEEDEEDEEDEEVEVDWGASGSLRRRGRLV
jgi:cobalamin biosynthesis protein CobT